MGHLGDTMIGKLYRCTITHSIYVLTELANGHALLECTHEPYDRMSMGMHHVNVIFTPITTEDS